MADELVLPKDMRLALLRYRGVTGVTVFEDEEGKRKILPTAFYLALLDMGRKLKHIESAPSIEMLLKKYGSTMEDLLKMVKF